MITLVDSSLGSWGRGGGQAVQFGLISGAKETGQPLVHPDGLGPIEPLNLRLHRLRSSTPDGATDNRWGLQSINDPFDMSRPLDPGESPLQRDYFTSLNRSTRETDPVGRSTIPATLRRIVDDLDGRYSLAISLGNLPRLRIQETPRQTGAVRQETAELFDAFDSAGAIGYETRGQFYDPAAEVSRVLATRDPEDTILTRGALGRDVRHSRLMQAEEGTSTGGNPRWGTTPSYDPKQLVTRDIQGGLVWSPANGGRLGSLQSVFAPELAAGIYGLGRERTPIGPLVIRHDAQFGYPAAKGSLPLVGPLALRPVDATIVDTGGAPFSGIFGFRPRDFGDPARGLGEYVPVVYVTAQLPAGGEAESFGGSAPGGGGGGGNPPPFAPPPGGGGGGGGGGNPPPGGGGGGGGGGGKPDKPTSPRPEDEPDKGPARPRRPKPVPYQGPVAPGAPGFAWPDGGPFSEVLPIGFGGVSVAPVPNSPLFLSQPAVAADLSYATAGPRSAGVETMAGIASGRAKPVLWSDDRSEAFRAKFGFGMADLASEDPPLVGGCGPSADAAPVPAMQETYGATNGGVRVTEGWASVSRGNGTMAVVGPDWEFAAQAPGAAYGPGRHNVLTAPAPFFGSRGSPLSLADHVRYQDLRLEAATQVLQGAFGGERSYAGSLSVLSRNSPSAPPTKNMVGHLYTAGRGVLRPDASQALEVRSILEAPAGGSVVASYGAVLGVTREQRGVGAVIDNRPLILLDNDRGARGLVTGDMLASVDRGVAITSDGVGILSGLQIATVGDKRDVLAVGYRADRGGLSGTPNWAVDTNGLMRFAAFDETPEAPDDGSYTLFHNGTNLQLMGEDGSPSSVGAGTGRTTYTTPGGASVERGEEIFEEIVDDGAGGSFIDTVGQIPKGATVTQAYAYCINAFDGTGTGASDSFSLGYNGVPARWGNSSTTGNIASGATIGPENYTSDPEIFFSIARSLRITANGFTMDGGGKVRIVAFYIPPTGNLNG